MYLATDPDREGEAISWHIANILGLNPADVSRIEFNEITKDAVTNAISHRALSTWIVDAQQVAAFLTALLVINWVLCFGKSKKGLSAGRVQSVAVKVIVDRENEIRNFKPEEFWTISATLKGPAGIRGEILRSGREEGQSLIRKRTLRPFRCGKGAGFIVSKVKSGTQKECPASVYYGFFTTICFRQAWLYRKKTMMLAQMLYEGVPLKDGEYRRPHHVYENRFDACIGRSAGRDLSPHQAGLRG